MPRLTFYSITLNEKLQFYYFVPTIFFGFSSIICYISYRPEKELDIMNLHELIDRLHKSIH